MTNTNLKFADIQIGDFFKEDHPEMPEVFQKVTEREAESCDDGVIYGVYLDFPVQMVNYSLDPSQTM